MSDKSSVLTSISEESALATHIYLAFKLFSPVELFLGTLKFENNSSGLKLHAHIVDYLMDREIDLVPSNKESFDKVFAANMSHIKNGTNCPNVHSQNYKAWALSQDLPEVVDIFKRSIQRVLADNRGLKA